MPRASLRCSRHKVPGAAAAAVAHKLFRSELLHDEPAAAIGTPNRHEQLQLKGDPAVAARGKRSDVSPHDMQCTRAWRTAAVVSPHIASATFDSGRAWARGQPAHHSSACTAPPSSCTNHFHDLYNVTYRSLSVPKRLRYMSNRSGGPVPISELAHGLSSARVRKYRRRLKAEAVDALVRQPEAAMKPCAIC